MLFAQSPFQNAYTAHPSVPQGLLEAVAWTNTHMVHLEHQAPSCSGYPKAYGIMGLHDDGQNYFIENGKLVEQLSGITVQQQKSSPENQIMAYASAFEQLLISTGNVNDPQHLRECLHALSEIPDSGVVNLMARDMQVYAVFDFMESNTFGQLYGFTPYHFDGEAIFGADNYHVLASPEIKFTANGIQGENNTIYSALETKSLEYGPAIWNPAATCNFSSRNGVAISAITIHTIQGSYAGAISWAQNCAAGVSYHYVIRSSDGQVTQMLLEADKGWHVGSENPYTIGYEHEGYVDDPSWYTEEMYTSSADLSRDIVNSGYGIPPLRTYYGASSATINVLGGCTKIKGHQHYPNQTHTDPGINWNWEKYYKLINNTPVFTTISAASGNLYDTGGAASNYQDDERELWLIEPANTAQITLNFTAFDLESGYDNLFIYDGNTLDAPLIGSFTGSNSPGTIVSSSGSLILEFRSDCGTTAAGWEANYTTIPSDGTPPSTSINNSSLWQTDDFIVNFTDTDNASGVAERFYLVAEHDLNNNSPQANGIDGFAYETFEDNMQSWTNVTGSYMLNSGTFDFNDTNEQNSNSYLLIDQQNGNTYLYTWEQTITSSSSNQRAGIHFFCDDATQPNRGNSYFVYLRENDNSVQIYSVTNDNYNLEHDTSFIVNTGQTYQCKVSYSPVTGWIKVFIDDVFVSAWQDSTPLTNGNAISLRTGGCEAQFDNVFVYQSRSNSVLVTAGSGDQLSIESVNAVPTGVIRSVVVDSANNWSTIDEELILLDFTPPSIVFLNDGTGNDIDTFTTSTISANWLAEDIHSELDFYEVAIGTLPTLDNVLAWNQNGLSSNLNHVLNNPIYNQTYHISVRATNNAGLMDQFMSDGQLYIDNLSLTENHLNEIILFPNPANEFIAFNALEGTVEALIYDVTGKLIVTGYLDESHNQIDVSTLATGHYNVMLKSGNSFVLKKLLIE